MLYKIGINTLASSLGRVLGSALALVSIGLMTRALGVAGFGSYATILAYLTTFHILADFGLYQLFTRSIGREREKERQLLSSFLTLRLLTAVAVIGAAIPLVLLFPYTGEERLGVLIASVGFVAMSVTQMFLGLFQAHVSIYKGAIAEVAGRLLQLVLVALAALTAASVLTFVSIFVAASILTCLLSAVLAWRTTSFTLHLSWPQAASILKTALPIGLSVVFTLLYFRLDTVMLSVMKPAEDVGYYNLAYRILETLIFFPAVFIGLFLPILSRQNREKASQTISFLFDAMLASAVPVLIGGVLLSTSIVVLAGGQVFAPASSALAVLFGAVGAIFFGTLFSNSVVALGLQRQAMWVYAAGFVFNLGANLIVIPRYSYVGAAWTTLLTEVGVSLLLALLVRRLVPFHPSIRTFFGVMAASGTLAGVLILLFNPYGRILSAPTLLVAVGVGALAYLIVASSFGPMLLRRAKGLSY